MKKIIYSVMSLIIMLSLVLGNSVQNCNAAELQNPSDTITQNFVVYCPFSPNGIHHYTSRGAGNLYKGTFTNHTLILNKTASSEYQCTYCNDVMITQADAETCKSTGYPIGTYGSFNPGYVIPAQGIDVFTDYIYSTSASTIPGCAFFLYWGYQQQNVD